MDKNGIQLSLEKTTCADGDECVCHTSQIMLCNVCKDIGCKKRFGR